MRRVHRTFKEKLLYVAMYECRQCHARKPDPRWWALYLGLYPRCPRCGTYRLTRLATRDRIDPMQRGLVNYAQLLWGAQLYHCRYCRVQFYDARKPVAPEGWEKSTTAFAVPVGAAAHGSDEN